MAYEPALLREKAPAAMVERLSEPQRYLIAAFEAKGLTMEKVAETLLDVMKNGDTGASKVAAADLAIRATIGLAPTKSASLNIHKSDKQDKFFSEETFEKLPPTATE